MAKRLTIMMRHPQFQHGAAGGWQIVYTGFILILLCFFILLTSFASLEQSKIMPFVKSFSRAVSVFAHGVSLEAGETMIRSKAMVVDKEDRIAALFQLVKKISNQNGLDQLNIRSTKQGVVMTLADKMLFEVGDAALSTSSFALLNKIGAMINKLNVRVDIEGHTDSTPIRTVKYASNWDLSTARAVNVLRYLAADGRVRSDLLSAVGFSKYHPMAPNNSPENRNQNRRVDFIFRPETP